MGGKLAKKLKGEAKAAAVEAHPKYRALEKQNKDLLARQEHGVEADKKFLKLQGELKETKAKYEAAHREIERLRHDNETITGLKRTQATSKVAKLARLKGTGGTAILNLSDWHVEEIVKPETVGGLNEFNLEIAEQRIHRTFQKALLLLEDARHLTNIRQMVVGLLGDFITGYIHPELEESNTLSPTKAIEWVKPRITGGLDYLLSHADLDQIIVVTARGNHGRTTQKERIKTSADNSYEQHLYHDLADCYRDRGQKKITFKIEEGYHNWLDIEGHPCRFHHGHGIKYNGGVGDLTIPMNKAVAKWNQARLARYDFAGHWHTFIPYGSWFVNGSLIGYSEWTLWIKGSYQPPQQMFCVMDQQYGITRSLPIFCN